jgi:hypothetical protein
MASQKLSIAEITQRSYDLLKELEAEERSRVILAVQTLFGDAAGAGIVAPPAPALVGSTSQKTTPANVSDIRAFFDLKAPENKGEELAVAARYRELNQDATAHTKEDFEAAVRAARRNFDSRNFTRDLNNAKIKGLFNKGKEHTLAYYGQGYVDALPDREALKKLRKPKGAARKAAAKKQSPKRPK